MSPLNWYSSSGEWDLAPSYDRDDARRFSRRATDDCLGCHTGRIAALAHSVDRYEGRPFHEVAIGCERCHGPGLSHVEFQLAGNAESEKIVPIVNPASLDPAERESVCYQCHLQAERVSRPGRSDLDFRPGEIVSRRTGFRAGPATCIAPAASTPGLHQSPPPALKETAVSDSSVQAGVLARTCVGSVRESDTREGTPRSRRFSKLIRIPAAVDRSESLLPASVRRSGRRQC